MDIKNLNNGAVANRANDSVKQTGKETAENRTDNNTSAANLDKVTLTQAFSQVSNLEQKARSVDIDNSARIAELKSAIQDGSYKVDAENVADKLMQTEALFSRF